MAAKERPCDLCGSKDRARRGYTIGWRRGKVGMIVLCGDCARPLQPFLAAMVEHSRRPPIRVAPTTGSLPLPAPQDESAPQRAQEPR